MLAVKFYLDLKKLKQWILPVMTPNFIRAFFLTNNRQIIDFLVKVNADGMSFDIDNRTYIIDKKTMWSDSKRQPSSLYFPDIPNPIKINPEKQIDNFMKNIRSGHLDKNTDSEGELVDISFSSTNLQLFKKSKIFDDLNKNPSAEKMQLALIGVIIFLIIVLIIAIVT